LSWDTILGGVSRYDIQRLEVLPSHTNKPLAATGTGSSSRARAGGATADKYTAPSSMPNRHTMSSKWVESAIAWQERNAAGQVVRTPRHASTDPNRRCYNCTRVGHSAHECPPGTRRNTHFRSLPLSTNDRVVGISMITSPDTKPASSMPARTPSLSPKATTTTSPEDQAWVAPGNDMDV
jgi:hypothetical protein